MPVPPKYDCLAFTTAPSKKLLGGPCARIAAYSIRRRLNFVQFEAERYDVSAAA